MLVETRHRFRSTVEARKIEIPHKIWRVSEELPQTKELLNGSPKTGKGFLRVTPIRCGKNELSSRNCRVKPRDGAGWGYERRFIAEFSNVHILPGEELEYEIVWGYDGAFKNHEPDETVDGIPHAVGLTTDGRGQVRTVALTLQFQRDLDGEADRTIEVPPTVYTSDYLDFPSAIPPSDFFHKGEGWRPLTQMQRCRERSGTLFDAYRWSARSFLGMAKATWTPHLNYFELDDPTNDAAGDKEKDADDASVEHEGDD